MRILLSAASAMFLLGAIYAYGVILPAFMAAFGWSRGTAALPHAVLLFVYALGMGIGGALERRLSPMGGAVLGGLAFGLGVVAAGHARSLLGVIIAYGILGGMGFGFAYVSAVTAALRAFPTRRGLAAGLVVGAFGLGAFVWAPLAQHFLPRLGWAGVFEGYGGMCAVLLPLLGIGLHVPRPRGREGVAETGVRLQDAVRTPLFWTLFAAYTLVTAVGLLVLAHLVIFAQERGLSPAAAAWLLSVAAIGSGAGRVVMGWWSDRVGRVPCLVFACFLEALLLLGLGWRVPLTGLYLLAGGLGFAFGTWLSLYGPTATDLFGLKYAGAIYGALYLSYGIGGLVGPPAGGALADLTGGYGTVWAVGAGLCGLAALLFLRVRRLQPQPLAHPHALAEEIPE